MVYRQRRINAVDTIEIDLLIVKKGQSRAKSQSTYIPRVPQRLSSRTNWDTPPLQSKRAPPPELKGWETHSPAGEEVGGPNSDDQRKNLALCLLCGIEYFQIQVFHKPYRYVPQYILQTIHTTLLSFKKQNVKINLKRLMDLEDFICPSSPSPSVASPLCPRDLLKQQLFFPDTIRQLQYVYREAKNRKHITEVL